MQLLQLVERVDDRRLEQQRLGLLAEGHLLLVVLLQVQVAQLLVDLDEVVEVLHVQVVGLPQVLDVLLRHDAGLLPALLQLAELREGIVDRLVGIDQLLELLDDAELDLVVGLLLGLQIGDEDVAATAVFAEELLELHLRPVDRRRELLLLAPLLDEAAARSLDFGAAQAVEGDLQRLDLPAQRLHGLLLEHPGKERHELLLALAGKPVLGRSRIESGRSLLVGLFTQFEPGTPGGQLGLLVRKIDLRLHHRLLVGIDRHGLGLNAGPTGARRGCGFRSGRRLRCRGGIGRCRRRLRRSGRSFGHRFGFCLLHRFCRLLFRLRRRRFCRLHRGLIARRNRGGSGCRCGRLLRSGCGRCRGCGGFGFGGHGGNRLHIFSHGADLLLGSRKCRFFSSHRSTRFRSRAYGST